MSDKTLSLKKNMIWNSMGSLINLGCQWLISVFIVRLANGYDAAGVYSLACSVYAIFNPFAQYRMYTYQITDVENENTTGEYLAFSILTTLSALVLCMGYSLVTCSFTSLPAIFAYAVYRTVVLLFDVLHACNQKNRRLDYVGISYILQGVFSLAIFIVSFALTGNLVLTLLLMGAVVLVIGLIYDYPRAKSFGEIRIGISAGKARRLLVRCFPLVVAAVAMSASPSVPRQYLSNLLGDSALGVYASVAAPVAIIQMGASYVYGPLLNYFSDHFVHNRKKDFLTLLAKSCGGIALVCLVCGLGIALLGRQLLVFVYGSSIAEYVYLLYPLVVLAFATGCTWFLNDLLMALRNSRGSFLGSVAQLAGALVSLPIIGVLGMNGATVASLISCAVGISVMIICLVFQLKVQWR